MSYINKTPEYQKGYDDAEKEMEGAILDLMDLCDKQEKKLAVAVGALKKIGAHGGVCTDDENCPLCIAEEALNQIEQGN